MKPNWITAFLACLICVANSWAAISVKASNSCSDPSITDPSVVEVTFASGKWDVIFKANASGEYWICGGAGDIIRVIRSDAPVNYVKVNTVGNTAVISAIEEITAASGGSMDIGAIRRVAR